MNGDSFTNLSQTRPLFKGCLNIGNRIYYLHNIQVYGFEVQAEFEKLAARVAELADALDSGSSDRKAVQVRALSRAREISILFSDFLLSVLLHRSSSSLTNHFLTGNPFSSSILTAFRSDSSRTFAYIIVVLISGCPAISKILTLRNR